MLSGAVTIYTDWEIKFGEIAKKPDKIERDKYVIRLYSRGELEEILSCRDMKIVKTFSNYYGKEETPKEMQLMVYSVKK